MTKQRQVGLLAFCNFGPVGIQHVITVAFAFGYCAHFVFEESALALV